MSLFELFKTKAVLSEETEFVNIYRMAAEGKEYKIVLTKNRANGHTVIHCEHNRILWEQVPRFPQLAGKRYGEKVPIFWAIPEKNCVTIFVVKGRPDGFVGLDEGVFCSGAHFDDHLICVMSYRVFKRL